MTLIDRQKARRRRGPDAMVVEHGPPDEGRTGRVATSIVVPAYNEEEGISVVLRKLLAVVDDSCEIIVVSDGSSDGTVAVASAFPVRVLECRPNRGKGSILREALRRARGRDIIWIDADDTYPAERIPEMRRLLADGADLVYVSRKVGRNRIPAFNRVGNLVFCHLIRTIYGFRPSDPCTGLCGVKKAHLERMGLRSNRFGIESEVAMKAGRMRLDMREIAGEYGARIGRAKLNGVKAGWEIGSLILKLATWRAPRPHAEQLTLAPPRVGEGDGQHEERAA